MTSQEQALVIEALKDLEQLLVDGVAAEVAKITGPYAPLVAALEAAVLPQVKSIVDGYIAKQFPAAA